MSAHQVVILGAGAAGTAAARTVAGHDDIRTTIVGQTEETPYTRMLVKGIAYGLTPPELIKLPMPQVDFLADTAENVNHEAREIALASGATITYDSLIVATGSRARDLLATIPGAVQAAQAGRLYTLHTLDDAVKIRKAILQCGAPARIAIYGAGMTASETASTLQGQGHQISLIARSTIPGIAAFGRPVAEQIAADHQSHVRSFFGRTINGIQPDPSGTLITLDDGTAFTADLIISALGTIPTGPEPWSEGVDVDDRLRVLHSRDVLAAGGIATHHDATLGTWRIDHWEDGAAQGTHAARILLHGLGRGEDPGPYLPRSPYMSMIYGRMISGVGYTGHPQTRVEDTEELIVLHGPGDTVVGASGVDAVGPVYRWAQHLHKVGS